MDVFVSCPVKFLVLGRGLINVLIPCIQRGLSPIKAESHLVLVFKCPVKLYAG